MVKDVDRYVAENRQRIRNVDSRFVEVDSNQTRDISFGPSTVTVGVSIEVYKRSTGGQILFDHPDPSHGFGRGTFGDDKGPWSLVEDAEASAQFTKEGRRAVVNALDGGSGAVVEGAAGSGSTTAATGDTALDSEVARSASFNTKDDFRTLRVHTLHDAADVVGNPTEFGVYDGGGDLLARITITEPTIANDEEVRVDVILEFVGDGIGGSVITNDGEESIADAMKTVESSTGPTEFAFGSGTTAFSKTDSALTTEEFRKDLQRSTDRDSITAKAHVYEVDQTTTPTLGDPHSVDIGEMAVFDNSGRMIWATTLRSFEKTEAAGFNAESLIRVS